MIIFSKTNIKPTLALKKKGYHENVDTMCHGLSPSIPDSDRGDQGGKGNVINLLIPCFKKTFIYVSIFLDTKDCDSDINWLVCKIFNVRINCKSLFGHIL